MDRTGESRWAEILSVAAIYVLVTAPVLLLGAASPDLRGAFAIAALAAAVATAVRTHLKKRRFPVPVEAIALAAAAAFTLAQALPVGSAIAGLLGGASFDRASEGLRAVGIGDPWSFVSKEPASTLAEGIRLWAWALVLASFAAIGGRRPYRRAILGAVALQGVLQALAGIATLAFDVDVRSLFTDNPVLVSTGFHGTLMNDNHAAGAFNLAAFAFVGLAFELEGRPRIVMLAGTALMALCTFAVGSRGGALVLVLTALAFLAWLRWLAPGKGMPIRSATVRMLLAFGFLAATALAFTAVDQFSFRFTDEERLDQAVTGKTSIWGPTVGLVEDHPWAGVGRGAFPVAVSAYNDTAPGRTFDYVENAPLQALADWGIPAGVAATVVIFLLGLRLLLAVSDRRALLAATFGVVAVVLHNLADFSLEIPGLALPVLAILGAAIGHRARNLRKGDPALRLVSARSAIVVTALSLGLIVPLAWANGRSRDATRQEIQDLAGRVSSGETVPVEEIESALAAAVRLHPLDAHLYDIGARIALYQHRYDRAAALADVALVQFPRSITASLVRMEADRARSRSDDAVRRLAGLVQLRPDAEPAVFGMLQAAHWPAADIARGLGDQPGALGRYVAALVANRKRPDAIRVLQARLDTTPEDLATLQTAGRLLLDEGQTAGADRVAVRLLALYPTDPFSWMLMAQVAWARNEHREAVALYREAARLSQDPTDAELGALRSLLLLGRQKEFDDLADSLEARVGRNAGARAQLLQLLASRESRAGRVSNALSYMDQAERLRPRDPTLPYVRAIIQKQAGDLRGARRELLRSLALDPSYRAARVELEAMDAAPEPTPDPAPAPSPTPPVP